MNVLFYQSYSRNNMGLYLATILNHRKYMLRHDYSFLADNTGYSPYLDTRKMKALLGGFDMVVTIGSDCVITDPARKMEDFLPDGKSFGVCIEGRGFSAINGEILLIRNTPEGIAVLDELEALREAYPAEKWGTQSLLNRVFLENMPLAEKIHRIEEGTLQSYVERNDKFSKCLWKKGDFLAHAVGGDNESKLERCRKVLAELKKPSEPSVVVITPTGDRLMQLATVADGIAAQTRKPALWIVADDGKDPVPQSILDRACCPVEVLRLEPVSGNSLKRNFLALLKAVQAHTFPGNTVVAVMEDDDYYPASYLEYVAGVLQVKPACGSLFRRYYQLSASRYRVFKSSRFACLHSTSFRASEAARILPLAEDDEPSGVDVRIWQAWDTDCIVDMQNIGPVGLKDWPEGRPGTMNAHRPHEGDRFTDDPSGAQLFRMMDAASAVKYRTVTVPPPVYDVVIPLGGGSKNNNEELRLALRSIDRYTTARHVWIVTDCAPDWVQNVKLLNVPDRNSRNKDANLIDKILAACREPELAETFIFLSDDQLFLAPYNPSAVPVIYNARGYDSFDSGSRWNERMRNTFRYLEQQGIQLHANFDAHTPVVYRKADFLRVMEKTDYVPEPGFCINTLACGLIGMQPELNQNFVKVHSEGGNPGPVTGKLFAGYNDAGFKVMRETLFERFPEKSKFEK